MLRIAMMVACLSVGQVRADAFDTSQLTASDFDTLGTLAGKWEDRAEQIDANSAIGKFSGLSVSDVYRETAQDLRGALNSIQDKRNTFDVAQVTGQDFGQRPPVPVSPELEKKYPTPNQAPVQAPQKQVQAPTYPAQPPAMACGMQMQTPVYNTNYSSGGRWRLFGRRANGGGFRLFGRRGGC